MESTGSSSQTNATYEEPFIVEPTSPHTHSMILLHGFGFSGQSFGEELTRTAVTSDGKTLPELFPSTRFIFPTAKRRESTMMKHAKLTQWFDVTSVNDCFLDMEAQIKGFVESRDEIFQLIHNESQRTPCENIILGGHSHGSAVALFCLLTSRFPLKAFVGLGGWVPFQPGVDRLLRPEMYTEDDSEGRFRVKNRRPLPKQAPKQPEINPFAPTGEFVLAGNTLIDRVVENFDARLGPAGLCGIAEGNAVVPPPVFLGHGAVDNARLDHGRAARKTLMLMGFNVTWGVYEGQNDWPVHPREMDDMVGFLRTKCFL
ncbi:acyl-protein thioesterase [Daldinia sp. FL1419]|nr:acyl-protein thioesterase [Daldinia sp. FL1419]